MKFLKTLLCVFMLTFLFIPSSTTYAWESSGIYPDYLNGDRNWIMMDGHMGGAQYLNVKSVKVESYNPPYYVITAQQAFASFPYGDWRAQDVKTSYITFYYDYLNKSIRELPNGDVIYDPNGPGYLTRNRVHIAQTMFYVAYRTKFFKGDYMPSWDSRLK